MLEEVEVAEEGEVTDSTESCYIGPVAVVAVEPALGLCVQRQCPLLAMVRHS